MICEKLGVDLNNFKVALHYLIIKTNRNIAVTSKIIKIIKTGLLEVEFWNINQFEIDCGIQ